MICLMMCGVLSKLSSCWDARKQHEAEDAAGAMEIIYRAKKGGFKEETHPQQQEKKYSMLCRIMRIRLKKHKEEEKENGKLFLPNPYPNSYTNSTANSNPKPNSDSIRNPNPISRSIPNPNPISKSKPKSKHKTKPNSSPDRNTNSIHESNSYPSPNSHFGPNPIMGTMPQASSSSSSSHANPNPNPNPNQHNSNTIMIPQHCPSHQNLPDGDEKENLVHPHPPSFPAFFAHKVLLVIISSISTLIEFEQRMMRVPTCALLTCMVAILLGGKVLAIVSMVLWWYSTPYLILRV